MIYLANDLYDEIVRRGKKPVDFIREAAAAKLARDKKE